MDERMFVFHQRTCKRHCWASIKDKRILNIWFSMNSTWIRNFLIMNILDRRFGSKPFAVCFFGGCTHSFVVIHFGDLRFKRSYEILKKLATNMAAISGMGIPRQLFVICKLKSSYHL